MTAEPDILEAIEEQEELEVKEPSMWLVVMHNDDKTTMEFVIMLLIQLFHKDAEEATQIMLEIHTQGQAVVGRFTHEVAEEKQATATRTARAYNQPLQITIEEE